MEPAAPASVAKQIAGGPAVEVPAELERELKSAFRSYSMLIEHLLREFSKPETVLTAIDGNHAGCIIGGRGGRMHEIVISHDGASITGFDVSAVVGEDRFRTMTWAVQDATP